MNIRWAHLLRFQLRSTAGPQPKPARLSASGQDRTKRPLRSLTKPCPCPVDGLETHNTLQFGHLTAQQNHFNGRHQLSIKWQPFGQILITNKQRSVWNHYRLCQWEGRSLHRSLLSFPRASSLWPHHPKKVAAAPFTLSKHTTSPKASLLSSIISTACWRVSFSSPTCLPTTGMMPDCQQTPPSN